LADGKSDFTIRPNIFIAYYISPEILSKKEWESVFDLALKKLWLNWGGITTIEKENELFQPVHTGVDNKSYHRGDSWFFINHIAGISLLRLNEKKYSKKINKIINASIEEMFNSGAIGAISEISSAHSITSFGCHNQAWSNATFIELMNEKWKKN
jgi:glycogen debranching enzyme